MKLKYITRLSLACGVMITAIAFSGCSGSPKAVQANTVVMSSSGVLSTEPSSEASDVSSSSTVTSSNLVSSSATQVSSTAMTSGVMSQKSSSLTPVTSKPSTGGGSTSRPASTRPASTTPAPTPRPASQAPASRPVSTAPAQTGVSAKYYGANYGCDDKSQYDYVLSHADVVGSSKYNSTYATWEGNQSSFESMIGVPYSAEWNKIVSIMSCFSGGTGSGSSGSAYDYFTGANRMCADKAKAMEAALHESGYNARLAGGTKNGASHMWVQVNVGGSWYNLTGRISTSLNAGYSLSSTGYNL